MRGAVLVVAALGAGCAANPPNGTFTSAEVTRTLSIQSGVTYAKVGPDLFLTDVHGNYVNLDIDEPVRASTPPDGAVRATTLRELVGECRFNRDRTPPFFSMSGRPCWMNRPLQISTVREVPGPSGPDFGGIVISVLLGSAAVGAVGGLVYCAVDCAKPWNVVVPVGVPLALVVTFFVGLGSAGSMGRIIRTNPPLLAW